MPDSKERSRAANLGSTRTFGKLTPHEAAAKAAVVHRLKATQRREERAESKAQQLRERQAASQLRTELAKMVVGELPSREEVGLFAGAVVLKLCSDILMGDIVVDKTNVAKLLQVAHEIMRLSDEKATAIMANHTPMTHDEKRAAASALLERAKGLRLVPDVASVSPLTAHPQPTSPGQTPLGTEGNREPQPALKPDDTGS